MPTTEIDRVDEPGERLLRLADVEQIAGIKRTKISALERAGKFPPRLKLAPRIVRWRRSDVLAWVRSPTV